MKLRSAYIGILFALLVFPFSQTLLAQNQNLEELRQNLSSPGYEARRSAVTNLFYVGEKRQLTKEEIDLLIPHLKSDADWRIKCYITLVLPYSENPDWVLPPLISALQDRNEQSNGNGNVPMHACSALTRLADKRGLQPSEEWLSYLESNPKVYGDLHDELVSNTKKRIAELKSKLKKPVN